MQIELSLKGKISTILFFEKVHISNIFNWHSADTNGMWNAKKLRGIYKTFEYILI